MITFPNNEFLHTRSLHNLFLIIALSFHKVVSMCTADNILRIESLANTLILNKIGTVLFIQLWEYKSILFLHFCSVKMHRSSNEPLCSPLCFWFYSLDFSLSGYLEKICSFKKICSFMPLYAPFDHIFDKIQYFESLCSL